MNISLTPELERYVRSKVTSGLYNNASEVIREALRALVEREGATGRASVRDAPRQNDVHAQLVALEKPLRQRGVTSLALFGSVVSGAAHADSDVDVLVDIAPDTPFSLVDLVALTDFLENKVGRKVDVVTRAGLDPRLRDRVLSESQPVF